MKFFLPLDFVGSEKPLLASDGQALQTGPGLENFTLLVGNGLRLGMTIRDQPIRGLADLADAILLRGHVLLELVKFPLEDFDMFEIVTELFGRHERLLVLDPEQDFVTLTQKLDENLNDLQEVENGCAITNIKMSI